MTDKQLILLKFIRDEIAERGVGPSFEEMKDYLIVGSKSVVSRKVKALRDMGYVRTSPRLRRSVELTNAGRRKLELIENELKRLAEAQGKCPTCGQAIREKAA